MNRRIFLCLTLAVLLITGLVATRLQRTTAQTGNPEQPAAILSFHATSPAEIDLTAVEAEQVTADFAWQVVNFNPEKHHLQISAYELNRWMVYEDDIQEASGTTQLLVRHPQNFGAPTFRLELFNGINVVEERYVTIPYNAVATDPTIEEFQSMTGGVKRSQLRAGNPSVQIQWRVANRIPNSHIVFEQVELPTDPGTNIELPRELPWVMSEGEGWLSPLNVEGATEIRIRMQVLVYGLDIEVYAESMIAIPIIEENATTVPTPAPQLTPATDASIEFTAPSGVAPGSPITFTWNAPDATSVRLERYTEDGAILTETIAVDLPAQGTFDYILPLTYHTFETQFSIFTYLEQIPFKLVTDDQRQQTLNVALTCVYSDYLSEFCPAHIATDRDLAYQPFEGGIMIWCCSPNAISIYVMYNDGTYEAFPDTYVEGEEFTVDETPPADRLMPIRGFGKVWAIESRVREKLGWALQPEVGYRGTMEYGYPRPNMPVESLITLPDATWLIFDTSQRWRIEQ